MVSRDGSGKNNRNIYHVKGGRVTYVHRDYSKTAAIREAKGYARDAQKHPRSTTYF
jgi:hypothetical protein